MRLPAQLGALRERQFRLLFTGQSVSLLGDGMAPVALAFAVLGLSDSATDLGLVLAARGVPLVLFLLAGGVFADRLPRRSVMLGSDLLRAASQGVLAALVIAGGAELWHFVVSQAPVGAASAFFLPASGSLVPQAVSAPRLQQANALLSLSASAGEVGGPAIAAVLVTTVGAGWALAADAATFLVSVLFLAQVRVAPHEQSPAQKFLRDLVDGWREFRSRTWLWAGVVYSSLGNMVVLAPFVVLGPVISKQSLGGASAWGLIVSAFALGSFAGGLAALHVRPRRPGLVFVAVLFPLALPLAALALGAPAPAVAAASLVAGAGLAFSNAVWITTVQRHVAPATLARVSAYDWFGSLAFHPLGLALAGPVAALLGVEATLWFGAAWIVASSVALIAMPSVRALRSEPPADKRPPSALTGPA